jgi:hypothetical protein
MAAGVTWRQAIQPGTRARTEAQAARAAGHGPRGAAQDTQPLLVNIMKSRGALDAAVWPADAMKTWN